MHSDQPKKPGRRWWQFSLRTFLLLVLLLGMGLGWLGTQLRRVHEQRRIVALIQQAGGMVQYDYQFAKQSDPGQWVPPGPQVLRSLFGDDLFARVAAVGILEGTPTDRDVEQLVEQIVELPDLRALVLCGFRISDRSLSSVIRIRWLHDLWLRDTSVTPLGLRQLAVAASLEKLRLEGASVTDAGMGEVARLTGLTRLQLSRCAAVTDQGLERLQTLKNLESLRIDGTAVTKDGLRILPELPKLKDLVLYGPGMGDGALEYIGQVASLQDLELSGEGVSAVGLTQLAKLKNLRTLLISNLPMGEAEISCLVSLKELRGLNVIGTPIGEAELQRLRPLTNLEYLHVTLGKSVPSEAMAEFRKALPKCRVTFWDTHGLLVKE